MLGWTRSLLHSPHIWLLQLPFLLVSTLSTKGLLQWSLLYSGLLSDLLYSLLSTLLAAYSSVYSTLSFLLYSILPITLFLCTLFLFSFSSLLFLLFFFFFLSPLLPFKALGEWLLLLPRLASLTAGFFPFFSIAIFFRNQ